MITWKNRDGDRFLQAEINDAAQFPSCPLVLGKTKSLKSLLSQNSAHITIGPQSKLEEGDRLLQASAPNYIILNPNV